jgi:hypothetical protein
MFYKECPFLLDTVFSANQLRCFKLLVRHLVTFLPSFCCFFYLFFSLIETSVWWTNTLILRASAIKSTRVSFITSTLGLELGETQQKCFLMCSYDTEPQLRNAYACSATETRTFEPSRWMCKYWSWCDGCSQCSVIRISGGLFQTQLRSKSGLYSFLWNDKNLRYLLVK